MQKGGHLCLRQFLLQQMLLWRAGFETTEMMLLEDHAGKDLVLMVVEQVFEGLYAIYGGTHTIKKMFVCVIITNGASAHTSRACRYRYIDR
jgi:hypothetical protein